MTEKHTHKRGQLLSFDSRNEIAPAEPLSPAFKALTDDETRQRAANDPHAGAIPPGFRTIAQPVEAENKEQITLRLDPDMLRHFRGTGKSYQSRINAVLKSYGQAKKKVG